MTRALLSDGTSSAPLGRSNPTTFTPPAGTPGEAITSVLDWYSSGAYPWAGLSIQTGAQNGNFTVLNVFGLATNTWVVAYQILRSDLNMIWLAWALVTTNNDGQTISVTAQHWVDLSSYDPFYANGINVDISGSIWSTGPFQGRAGSVDWHTGTLTMGALQTYDFTAWGADSAVLSANFVDKGLAVLLDSTGLSVGIADATNGSTSAPTLLDADAVSLGAFTNLSTELVLIGYQTATQQKYVLARYDSSTSSLTFTPQTLTETPVTVYGKDGSGNQYALGRTRSSPNTLLAFKIDSSYVITEHTGYTFTDGLVVPFNFFPLLSQPAGAWPPYIVLWTIPTFGASIITEFHVAPDALGNLTVTQAEQYATSVAFTILLSVQGLLWGYDASGNFLFVYDDYESSTYDPVRLSTAYVPVGLWGGGVTTPTAPRQLVTATANPPLARTPASRSLTPNGTPTAPLLRS